MLRIRLKVTDRPRRALILTDTPNPHCADCAGEGGNAYDYGDESGEYAGTEWDSCRCWDESRRWIVLPLPHLRRPRVLRRRHDDRDPWGPAGYSDEPPLLTERTPRVRDPHHLRHGRH